jgi:hypothetical protein
MYVKIEADDGCDHCRYFHYFAGSMYNNNGDPGDPPECECDHNFECREHDCDDDCENCDVVHNCENAHDYD